MDHLLRCQHPVGQGNFYEEVYNEFISREIRIVYDCGSDTEKKSLNASIDRLLGKTIHGLFISHFHRDHINGLPRLTASCELKTVFMPYLKPWELDLLVLELVMDDGADAPGVELALAPDDVFPESDIVRITSERGAGIENVITERTQESVYFNDGGILQNAPDILSDVYPIFIGSRTSPIQRSVEWALITFVPDRKKYSKKIHEALLNSEELNYDAIDNRQSSHELAKWLYSTSQSGRKKNATLVADIYNKVIGLTPREHNRVSMCLYSGPLIPSDRGNWDILHGGPFPFLSRDVFERTKDFPAWLGTGDQEFKNVNGNLSNIGKEFQRHYGDLLENVGVIQVPHHGSKNNYHRDLFPNGGLLHVISCGMNNPHGHPDADTISEIVSRSGIPVIVTEQAPTIFHHAVFWW